MYNDIYFSRENLDTYLKELAKEFRKLNGKTMPAEIILIGGASILANYGFREMTYDIDAVVSASSAMKDARLYNTIYQRTVKVIISTFIRIFINCCTISTE